jgi:hypothetical protein
MHYFTFRCAKQLAARYGFSITDLNQEHSRFNKLPRPLARTLYSLWRTFGMGTFRLVLMKNAPLSALGARGAGGEGE